MIKRVDHVSIVVESTEEALKLFRDVLGARVVATQSYEKYSHEWTIMDIGTGAQLELLEPWRGSGGVSDQFLTRHGEGVHHVTLETSDVRDSIARLESVGIEPFHTDLSDPTWQETFIHPRQSHGVLYQLVERTH